MTEDGLTRAERIELLMHRCQLSGTNAELWPYDDRFEVNENLPWSAASNGLSEW